MDINEVKKFIEENKESEELMGFLGNIVPQKESPELNLENVKLFLNENYDAKRWIDSEKDRHYQKAFETWKNNNYSKEIDKEIKKRFPEKDEKDIELERMKAEFEKMKAESTREKLRNKAIKVASEKQLPSDLVDYFVGEDEESTTKNLETLNTIFSNHIKKAVEDKLKDGSYVPPGSEKDKKDPDLDAFMQGLGLSE